MRVRFASTRLAAAAAALLGVCLQPTQAQVLGTVITATTGTMVDPYNEPVVPLPSNCYFLTAIIPDGAPRPRPSVTTATYFYNPYLSTSAQVVAPGQLKAGFRRVAYSYNFTQLGLSIPNLLIGIFRVESVRTTVYEGPGPAFPLVSDRTALGVNNVSWSSSAGEAPTGGIASKSVFQNTWLVRNISTGTLERAPNTFTPNFTVGFECLVSVRP
jgi:hypothetical protein